MCMCCECVCKSVRVCVRVRMCVCVCMHIINVVCMSVFLFTATMVLCGISWLRRNYSI